MLMESHNKKTVNLKNLVFKDTWGEPVEARSKVADWVPTSEQLKNEKWYPTINLPVSGIYGQGRIGRRRRQRNTNNDRERGANIVQTTDKYAEICL